MSFELILPFLRPIEPLLLDDSISEIMGNPDASWWYERDGIMRQEATISFHAGQLRTGLEVIANQLGKKLDEDNPLLHAQLPDGSRLAAVIPPVVRPAPTPKSAPISTPDWLQENFKSSTGIRALRDASTPPPKLFQRNKKFSAGCTKDKTSSGPFFRVRSLIPPA